MTGMYTTEIFYIPSRLTKTAQKQNHNCTIKGTNINLTPVQSQLALSIAQSSSVNIIIHFTEEIYWRFYRCKNPGRKRDFSHLWNRQPGSGAHPTAY